MTNALDTTGTEEVRLTAILKERLVGRVLDLLVVVRDKGVVLQGRADTFYAKQLAQHVVMEATTLPILANEIKVS